MNKTIKVNLAGFVFQLDDDAYELLKSYLLKLEQKFESTIEGSEIVADIEGRIAELLSGVLSVGREVISLHDIEGIISVMGEPEVYLDEDEETSKPYQRLKSKLYREPNNALVGGVASGIATYLGINSAWIRLGFFISLFAWTFGFWVYAILWIALPKRSTPLFRRDENSDSGLVQILNGVFSVLGRIVKLFFRIVTIVFGLSFVLFGLPVIITILGISIFPEFNWLVIDGWGMAPQEVFSFLDFAMVSNGSDLGLILFLMVAIIPILMLIYWGVKLLFLIKVKDAWLHFFVGILWFISLVLLGVVMLPNATLFVQEKSSYERVELSVAPDTLWLMMNAPIDQDLYNSSIVVPDNALAFYYNKEQRKSCGLVELDIHHSSDSVAYFSIGKDVTGASRSQARRNLDKMTYSYVHNNKYLALDEGYSTWSEDMPWIPSRVQVDLFVPSSTVLVVDKRIKRLVNAEESLCRSGREIVYK